MIRYENGKLRINFNLDEFCYLKYFLTELQERGKILKSLHWADMMLIFFFKLIWYVFINYSLSQ